MIRCDVVDPETQKTYERDPRGVARRAEAYLTSTGVAEDCYVGPEPEFFVFDGVSWENHMHASFYKIRFRRRRLEFGVRYRDERGHRPRVKGGYFPVPPVDSSQDLRTEMAQVLEACGLVVEAHSS